MSTHPMRHGRRCSRAAPETGSIQGKIPSLRASGMLSLVRRPCSRDSGQEVSRLLQTRWRPGMHPNVRLVRTSCPTRCQCLHMYHSQVVWWSRGPSWVRSILFHISAGQTGVSAHLHPRLPFCALTEPRDMQQARVPNPRVK